MAEKIVHARVSRRNYVYRGNSLGVGRIVRMTEAQFKATQNIRPPYLEKATPEQVEAATSIIDLATVEAPKAANVEAAENPEPPKPASKK